MFQFRAFPSYAYLIQRTIHRYCLCGFPHSEISGSTDICSSPKLIAACHVLRRLLMPRHSPCALYSLTSSVRIAHRSQQRLRCSSLAPSHLLFLGKRFAGLPRKQVRFGALLTDLRLRDSVLLNYAGNHRSLRKIVIVTLIFPDVVPQLKFTTFLLVLTKRPLCCLAFLHHILFVQFSRCNCRPGSSPLRRSGF